MFARSSKPQSAPPPPLCAPEASRNAAVAPVSTARVHPVLASVIGPDLIMEGSIVGDVELVIEGAVRGDLHVTRALVSERAHVEGRIRAQSVEVRGRVIGDIEAQKVVLTETAYVQGDILHEQLSVEPGAYFQGVCRQPPVAPPAAANAQAAMPASSAQAQMPCDWDKAS